MTNGHAWGDRGGCADPDVGLDNDRCVGDEAVTLTGLDRMSRGAERHARSDQHTIADRDPAEVQKEAALVHKDAVAELYAESVIAIERRVEGEGLWGRFAEDLAQQSVPSGKVAEGQRVEA